jgi:hypothetical protein
MIENQAQYHITKKWADRFEEAIRRMEEEEIPKPGARGLQMYELELAALRSQLIDLMTEIRVWETWEGTE